jgi:PadR family transcriptional regulator AphA
LGLSKLYAQLKQLEEAGLVEAQMEPQPSRPARKVYHLTPEGRAVFLEWVRQPTPYLRHLRVEFLARLYFFRWLALDGLDELVARQQAVCQDQIERFERLAVETGDEFRRCVLEFRRGQLEAVVGWLDRCLETLS